MNAGQMIMSIMQDVTQSVTPDVALAAVPLEGQQTKVAGGFADLLTGFRVQTKAMIGVDAAGVEAPLLSGEGEVPTEFQVFTTASELLGTLRAEAHREPSASQVQDEVAESEPEPVDVSGEDFFTDVIQGNLEMNTAEAQMVLAAYAQPARMPIVNTPPSHEVGAVQNVPTAAAAEQPLVASASPVKVQTVVQPEQQLSQPAELIPPVQLKTAEAPVPSLATPPQKIGRMPAVNTPPSHEVDTVQNVPAAPKAEQPSVTSATSPKAQFVEPVQSTPQPSAGQEVYPVSEQQSLQTTPTATQPVEEITFSLSRPITVSKAHPLESNRMPQATPVLRSQIISLDLEQLQNSSAEFETVRAVPEGTLSAQRQEVGRTPIAVMPANPEAGLTQKERPEIVMTGTAAGTSVLQPETNNLVKGAADIRSASLQQAVHSVPAQLVPDARSENGRPSSTLSVTKENVVSQQNMLPAGEAALTSDDSMSSSGDQAWSGQTSDSQMVTPQVHAQSKSEHQTVGPVLNSRVNAEQSRQDLPEQVVHQVRERLTQHEVKSGSQQITLTLSPENLGELKMNLNLQGQRLSVEIVTENRAVRDAILQHSDSLKESLARQNISVESFDVTTNGRGAGNPGHNQDAWKELARQKQPQFWASTGGYRPSQVGGATNPLAYQAKNEHAMLDIHY